MQKIDDLTLQIGEAIRNSDEYIEYKRLEKIIDMDPNLRRLVDDFRKENFELQNNEEIEDMLEASAELNRRYADMRARRMVNRYLTSEICLCRLVEDVCRAVVDAVDFDTDFLK